MPRVLFRNKNDPSNPSAPPPGIAELPRVYIDTSEIQPTGNTIVVNAGDYHLSGSSPYNNAGTDGLDIGADIDAINAATAGVV